MPNGKGPSYHTASMTVVGVGKRSEEILTSFSNKSTKDERIGPNEFNIIKLGAGKERESTNTLESKQIRIRKTDSQGIDIEKDYLEPVKEKEPEFPNSAPVIRHYIDSKANFLPLFNQLESKVIQDAVEDRGNSRLSINSHLNLFVGDISEPIVRGVLPIVGKILQSASDTVEIPTINAGILLSPTCSINPNKSVPQQYRRAYIGLREATTLLIDHDPTEKQSISLHPSIMPTDKTDIEFSERVFDHFTLLGYQPNSETPGDTAAKGRAVLSVLLNLPLSTAGHGTLHLPGFGGKASSPKEVRLSSNKQLTTTPVPWVESLEPNNTGEIDERTAKQLWAEEDDRTIPINYLDKFQANKEKDQFVDRDVGVYELAPNSCTKDINRKAMSIEQGPLNESLILFTNEIHEPTSDFGRDERRYVVFHPDVDPFAVSPYSTLHERYADDLLSLTSGMSPYPLAYPELVDVENYTMKP